mgnify:CR=1 FL=1
MDKNRSVVKIAAYKGERKKEMKKIGFIGVGIMGKSTAPLITTILDTCTILVYFNIVTTMFRL